jgi:DNA primase large subunit
LKEFIQLNELNYPTVPEEEFKELQSVLLGLVYRQSGSQGSSPTFFKVPFTEALDLVRGRKVFVRGGMCYVPDTEMLSLVSWIFKSMLTQNLVLTNKVNQNMRLVTMVDA